VFTADAVAYFQRVVVSMKNAGCDAVVLGCTEIPLIVSDSNSSLPTLDSTRLFARAALRRALGAPAAANAAILGNADSPTLFARIPRAGVD